MATHSIDNLPFSFLRGVVPPRAQTIETIERKGRDDVIRRFNGFQSPPFTLTSVNAVPDYNNATAALRAFAEKKLLGGLVLVKDDHNYFTIDQLFVVVLEVQPTVQQQRTLICGQLVASQHFELRARWTLRFVSAA